MLIPAKNGAQTLPELLAMLSLQTVNLEEIIVADSGSEDATVDIALRNGARVVHVDPDTFDHGGTRSFLCEQAKGDILIFFTQDAIPTRRDAIELLITPMLIDESIATCYGRQLPSFDADHFAASLRAFNYPSESVVRTMQDRDRFGLKTVFTSNSFACYHKQSLRAVEFFKDGLIFGEDTITVARLLKNGKKIAYVAEAGVYHSHNYEPLEECKRYFDIGVLHTMENWFLTTFGSAEGQGKQYIKHELRSLRRSGRMNLLPELILRIGLKYIGYTLGRNHRRLPQWCIARLSLHSRWWNRQK